MENISFLREMEKITKLIPLISTNSQFNTIQQNLIITLRYYTFLRDRSIQWNLLNHLEDLCTSERSIEKQEKREEAIEKTKTKKR